MEYRPLGNTGEKVSVIGLGTMTWGKQNTQEDGFEQMDYALEQGVNLFDAAEIYPVPPEAETYGDTERIIGEWFVSRNSRDKVILASKVSGRSTMPWLRDGAECHLNREQIEKALDASLKRLRTDRIDLYQLHWPERRVRLFGGLGYKHYDDEEAVPPEETLQALTDLVRAGKIRWVGLSNETPWGLQAFLRAAREQNLAAMVSVQNAYNLLNRTYELGLSEFFHREQVGLLAYSPLAQGVLSGKYLDGARPPNARFTLFDRGGRYQTPRAEDGIRSYMEVAARHGLDPSVMAHAFVVSRPFVTSSLIGATTMPQLRTAIEAGGVQLSEEALKDIDGVHLENSNPCP